MDLKQKIRCIKKKHKTTIFDIDVTDSITSIVYPKLSFGSVNDTRDIKLFRVNS